MVGRGRAQGSLEGNEEAPKLLGASKSPPSIGVGINQAASTAALMPAYLGSSLVKSTATFCSRRPSRAESWSACD